MGRVQGVCSRKQDRGVNKQKQQGVLRKSAGRGSPQKGEPEMQTPVPESHVQCGLITFSLPCLLTGASFPRALPQSLCGPFPDAAHTVPKVHSQERGCQIEG